MNLLSVIIRELRAAARHGFTYWLRVLGAGIVLIFAFMVGVEASFRLLDGKLLFRVLAFALFLAIWLFIPLMTADCISQERREGTLGLLFLTPLKPLAIVLAKSFVHGLRAATLAVAAVPVLTITILLGGVTWQEALTVVLILTASGFLALAAGLVASAWAKAWARALLLGGVLGAIGFAAFLFVAGIAVFEAYTSGWMPPFLSSDLAFWEVWSRKAAVGWIMFINPDTSWSMGGMPLASGYPRVMTAMGILVLLSFVLLLLLCVLAAWSIRRHWQEEPPSACQLWLERKLCTPVLAQSFFHRWMRRKLEKNPIGWLEQRRWSGRVLAWSWFGVVCSLLLVLVQHQDFFRGGHTGGLIFLAWVMAACLALTSAGSFRRERETGVLELLLVTPLSASRIVFGRLLGLWSQFLPTAILLLALWIFYETGWKWEDRSEPPAIIFLACSYLTVPVIGLYFSLRCRHFIVALTATVGLAIALPLGLSSFIAPLIEFPPSFRDEATDWSQITALLLQLPLAWALGTRLYRDLEQRRFALHTMARG